MKLSVLYKLFLVTFAWCLMHTVALAQFPTVDVTKGPLFAAASRVNPNMVLSLSVEFPTVGAAYRTTAYDNTLSYIGYWDADACYTYIVATGAVPAYFSKVAAAVNHQCTNKFSGNMLNWAAHSAVDMLRYALTGGDRIYDTATQTILQRAVIQDNFYNNGTYFPSKRLDNANLYTPFTGTVYIASCLDNIFFGTNVEGTCTTPARNANLQANGTRDDTKPYTFKARVEVCTASEGAARTELCRKYPNGNFKPAGSMQEYSDRMRFSAFGYLNESGNARYGGVLRAPMKYVGPIAYNNLLNQITNTAPEWDTSTGVFAQNPLNDTTGQSGVVNYLNKFGRTGTPGLYKSNDPVSELYYETIRYLQGLQPTPQAVSAPTTAGLDGFPIYATWADPLQQSCQKNYIVQIADAYTHNDKSIPGNTRINGSGDWARGYGAGDPNIVQWTDVVGSLEANTTVSQPTVPTPAYAIASNGNGFPNTGLNGLGSLPGGCCDASHYIAGLAYWANTQPFRSITIPNSPAPDPKSVRAKTFVINVDENGNGTITNRERIQQLYLAAKYGGFDDKNTDGNPFKTIDSAGAPVTNNSEWSAGVDDNGQPKPSTYFLASNPDKMIAAIKAIFSKVANDSGTISGGALSSAKIDPAGTYLYVPSFSSSKWSGSIQAYQITYTAGVVNISNTPTWDAGKRLTGDVAASIAPVPTIRNVFTAKTDGTGVQFDYANLDTAQQALLDTNYYTGIADGLGSDRIKYLRGDRTKEDVNGGPFRGRDSIMGDIINSSPESAGVKPARSIIGNGYAAWYDGLTRTPAVYVGTNAGMLHAFNANTGTELFAFVPPMVMNKLSAVTSPSYVHMPLIDAPPLVAEAQVGSNWKSVLISGAGGGAQGVFALDVTHPETFIASSYMWQFTDKDDPDMGYLMTSPKIYKLKTSANTYKWYAAVASGYDNYATDGTGNFSATGAGALFLLDLSKPSATAWQRDVNYYKIVLPVGGTITDVTIGNALSTPAAFRGPQGEAQYLYAGDIQGNVWKFDFTSSPPPWSETNALAFTQKPLFTAINAENKRQPITIEPTIGSAAGGGIRVLVGTGKFIENADLVPSTYINQSIYGLWDDGNSNAGSKIASRSNLQPRTATTATGGEITVTGSSFVYGNSTGQKKGWYFDFPNSGSTGTITGSGERQVTNMLLFAGDLYFNSLIPTADVCGNSGGGNSCVLNSKTGLSNGATCTPSTVGLLSSPIILELGTTVSDTNSSGRSKAKTTTTVINVGTGGKAGTASPSKTSDKFFDTSRLTWREIIDFKELQKKP
jgi:type IV pilus assembly protein PilY1